jgi:hypothetical protein
VLRFLGRHPFLLVGLATLALFFSVEALDRGGWTAAAAWLARPLRILILPMYMVWLPVMMVNTALLGFPPLLSMASLGWRLLSGLPEWRLGWCPMRSSTTSSRGGGDGGHWARLPDGSLAARFVCGAIAGTKPRNSDGLGLAIPT